MKRANSVDPKRVIAEYERLGNQTAVARLIGMSQSRVSGILRQHGITTERGAKQKKVDPDEVVRLWHETQNQHEIARRLGVVQTTISMVLRKQGIHAGRGRRNPLHDLPLEEITNRYLAGESAREIGESFGVGSEVVRKRLARHGVARRVGRAPGEKHPNWKGGRAQVEWYRRQSYEVAAICLGRPLPPGLIIHHCDENPQNNDPANLVLFRTQSEHFRFHQLLSRLQREGQPIDATQLALENGALALPQPPRPIEFGLDIDLFGPSETPESPKQGRAA